MLTDQVEAQGVKISDLQSSLEEHQHKLDSTEEMLQQVRTINPSAQLEKPSHTPPGCCNNTVAVFDVKCEGHPWSRALAMSNRRQSEVTSASSPAQTFQRCSGQNNLDNRGILEAQPHSRTVSQSTFQFAQGETSLSGQVITPP